ncbi:MAG: hypothetical protein ABIH23_19715 [bacterium]
MNTWFYDDDFGDDDFDEEDDCRDHLAEGGMCINGIRDEWSAEDYYSDE